MELKELTDRTFELFGIDSADKLGSALLDNISNTDKLKAFCDLVDGDLSIDWMQMIYQYYLADRKEKKQDYTPKSLARFMGALAGGGETITDMCAGSGALIIQKWNQDHDMKFRAIEIDGNVIPFLLFNMVLRNIRCDVYQMDVLTDEEPTNEWTIRKGEMFGCIT
jgi:type I restriction enzyme M protein